LRSYFINQHKMIWFVILTIGLIWLYKPLRFYVLSFWFPFLYRHPRLAVMLGIQFRDDITWATNHEETRIYIPGIYGYLFTKFTGLPIETTTQVRKELLYLQGQYAKNISMEHYFTGIQNKKMTLTQFEDFLSNTLLIETNRVFNILDDDKLEQFNKNLQIARHILSGLTYSPSKSIINMIKNYRIVLELRSILHSVSGGKRLLLLIPHLSLIDGFSKMIVKTNGDLSCIQPVDFFELTSKFFVWINNDQLTFVTRNPDNTNTANNRTFGIAKSNDPTKMRFFCPGNVYVMKFIKSILSFLKSLNINVTGDSPIISTNRFYNITNKDSIMVEFTESQRPYMNDHSD